MLAWNLFNFSNCRDLFLTLKFLLLKSVQVRNINSMPDFGCYIASVKVGRFNFPASEPVKYFLSASVFLHSPLSSFPRNMPFAPDHCCAASVEILDSQLSKLKQTELTAAKRVSISYRQVSNMKKMLKYSSKALLQQKSPSDWRPSLNRNLEKLTTRSFNLFMKGGKRFEYRERFGSFWTLHTFTAAIVFSVA